jgi:hypothetical protein
MKRIFIGYNNEAGVGSRLKEGFAKLKYKADFYSFHKHSFGYKADKIVKLPEVRIFKILKMIYFTFFLAINFDYFIFISSGSLFRGRYDLRFFRFLKKPLMIIHTGCDIRIPEKVKDLKWNPCERCTTEYKDYVNCKISEKEKTLEIEKQLFDFIVIPAELSSSMIAEHYLMHWPVDLTNFPDSNLQSFTTKKRLKILHAPSNEIYKGSKYIYNAIEQLKDKYDFEFKIVKNLPIQELYEEILSSDLIIDQMGGYYGLLSIESMALYKPVVVYIYDQIWSDIKNDCPLINANPDNLYHILEDIILNPEQLEIIGKKSREFVEKYHSDEVIATNLIKIFEGSLKSV